MKTLGSGGGAGLQLQAESRARTQHVLCSTPTRLGHRSQGRWLCMVRLGLMFIPDPRTTAIKGLILEAVKWDPGGGEVDPHRAKETWILSGPPKALAQPASSSPASHRSHVMGTAGKLVFLPPVGPASLGSSGMLWSLSSPCTDIPGSPELVLPFPGIPQPPWPHTHPPRDPPGVTWQRARNALCKYHVLCKCDQPRKGAKQTTRMDRRETFPPSLANSQLMIVYQP